MTKRIWIAAAFALSALAVWTQNTSDFQTSAANGTVTITKYRGSAKALVIPAAINGLPVTAIGEDAFSYHYSLTAVTIPSSVTAIGDSAFSGCSSLTTITVDNQNSKYISIDSVLFDKNIQTIIAYPAGKRGAYTIPSSVTAIGNGAFRGCSSLTAVTIPSSVTAIGEVAFNGCTSLTAVTIPSSVTVIGERAFLLCTSLTAVTIPSSVTAMGDSVFWDCSRLTSVTILASVTAIGNHVFYGCRSLTTITISSSITEIGWNAFYGCTSLTAITVDNQNNRYASMDGVLFDKNIQTIIIYPAGKSGAYTIPSSVTAIGDDAFDGCSSLTAVTIPSSVTAIEGSAFDGCSSLTTITVDNQNSKYASMDGVLFDKNIQTIIRYPAGKSGAYTIPSSVTTIGDRAFFYCSSLTAVTIPSSVTAIEDGAFGGCRSLTTITIPSSITTIGGYAFAESSLTTVTIPSSVTTIKRGAFTYCNLNPATRSEITRRFGNAPFENDDP